MVTSRYPRRWENGLIKRFTGRLKNLACTTVDNSDFFRYMKGKNGVEQSVPGIQARVELQNANIIETKVSAQQTQVEISCVG
jgi:hypothetical protein